MTASSTRSPLFAFNYKPLLAKSGLRNRKPETLPPCWIEKSTAPFDYSPDSDHRSSETTTATKTAPLWTPRSEPQRMALESMADEVYYGGSAGGGKTDLLIGLALMHQRRSVIFRREYGQLAAIIDRVKAVLEPIEGRYGYNGSSLRWQLPDGRLVELGAAQHEDDVRKWRGRPHDGKFFDELPEFTEQQYLFLGGWARTTVPGQRVRRVGAGNPPTDAAGEWVIQRWAPWLDEQHANPAEPGELRWFVRIDGADTEVEDATPFEHKGETLYPTSRTFIPAKLADNEFLSRDQTYRATLQSLPEPLRSQLLYGDHSIGLQDDEWQLLPSAWVRQAQERWTERPPAVPVEQTGMDVAQGGRDNTVFVQRRGAWFSAPVSVPGVEVPDASINASRGQQALLYGGRLVIDGDGIGASTYHLLRPSYPDRVHMYLGSAPTKLKDTSGKYGFENVRAAAHWHLRMLLDPANEEPIALPPSRELRAELTASHYSVVNGKIKVEKKDDVKARLGRSPDCFVAGTKVLTPSGERNIEDILLDDLVCTPWGDSRVMGLLMTGSRDLVTLALEDGRELTGKPDHAIFTFERGWIKLVDLSPSDTVSLSVWNSRTLWRLLGLLCSTAERTGFKRAVKDAGITSGGPRGRASDRPTHPFIETSTSSSTGRSRTGSMSTTTTRTASTMTQPTSWRGPSTIISPNTCAIGSTIPSTALAIEPTSMLSEIEQLLGIDLPRGAHGIERMLSSLSGSLPLSASSAEPACWLPRATSDSVPRPASSVPLQRIAATSRWNGLALAVANALSRASTDRGSRVRCVVRHSYANPVDVYDLTLERHNAYWANGVLAENCADATVMAAWEDPAWAAAGLYGLGGRLSA